MTGPSLPSVKHRGWYTVGSGRRGIQGGTGGLEDGTRAIKGASIRGIHSRWVGTRRIAGGTRYKESSTKGTQSWGIARIIGSHRAQSLPCPREILWHATSCDRVTWLASGLCLFVQILGNDPPLSFCHCEVMNILFDSYITTSWS